jgi:hypothetical protein
MERKIDCISYSTDTQRQIIALFWRLPLSKVKTSIIASLFSYHPRLETAMEAACGSNILNAPPPLTANKPKSRSSPAPSSAAFELHPRIKTAMEAAYGPWQERNKNKILVSYCLLARLHLHAPNGIQY